MVREAADDGMDFIKIVYSDCHISFWPKKTEPLDKNIIAAIIDEAHRHNMPVACHVDNLHQADAAVDLGADEIHHLHNMGSPAHELDDYTELFIKMCRDNVWIVPTIVAPRAFESARIARDCLDGTLDSTLTVLRRAYETGVQFGAGCDSGCPGVPWGRCLWEELAEYVYNLGMTPLEAIRCATSNNARLLGMETQIGCVRSGAYADLLILNKNPAEDIGNLDSIHIVTREGKIVVDRRCEVAG